MPASKTTAMGDHLRLQVVKQFEHLNLKYNQELMQTVAYASKLCNSPISSITLLDEDTQWIKVNKGLELESLPRELSFCTHIIQTNNMVAVSDLHEDECFSKHPFVTGDPKLRFYAGVPLITSEGHRVGTLCVMDYKPHVLTHKQKLIFKILARHAMSIMELKLSADLLDKSIAALKRLRINKSHEEIKLRSMFESLTDVYFLFDKESNIVDFNRSAYKFVKDMYGKTLTYGSVLTDFVSEASWTVFTKNYQKALNGEKVQREVQSDYELKGKVWMNYIYAPVRDDVGELFGVSLLIRDINERKTNEEKILEQNRRLSRIAEIQSHDYRGPLASILGLMNLIESEDYVAPREYLILMKKAVEKLDEKIHKVVDIVNNVQPD